jgi:hypothetical protein
MVTDTVFNDTAVYQNSLDYLPIRVDAVSSVINPPKKDKSFGKPGWFVGSRSQAQAIGIAPDAYNEVRVRAQANAQTKWAPAKAYATAYGENGGGGDVIVYAQSRALGKPGLQYGAVSTYSDATAISGGATPGDAGAAIAFSTSRATSGQGITVSSAKGYAESANAAFVVIDSRANSAKWYMAPGNSIAGGEAFGRGGHVGLDSTVRARADLGTATVGLLSIAKSNGAQPAWFDLRPVQQGDGSFGNIIYTITDNDPRADAGAAIGGTINIGTAPAGKVVLLNDNMESSAAVGEAAAGVINVAVANDGNVLIGDYDNSDATQNEVIAKVRGRGTAQGGMINIGALAFAFLFVLFVFDWPICFICLSYALVVRVRPSVCAPTPSLPLTNTTKHTHTQHPTTTPQNNPQHRPRAQRRL